MDDIDAYDTASQYGQGFDDTASIISGYTARTQRTTNTGLLLEESLAELDLNDSVPGPHGVSVPKTILEDDAFDGVLEENEGKEFEQDESADLPPHACRYI